MSKVVYKASCWDCDDFYIGKTKRRLHDRKTEHFKALAKSCHTSAREDQGVREVIPHFGPIPIIIPFKLFLDLPRDPVFPRGLSDNQSRGQLSRFPRNATRLSRIACKHFMDECEIIVSVFKTQIGKESLARICFRSQLCGNYTLNYS